MANFDPLSPFSASDRLALVCKWVFCPRRPRDRCHWLWGERKGGRGEIPARKRESARKREGGGGGGASPPPHAKCPYQARLKAGFLSALKRGASWALWKSLGVLFHRTRRHHHHHHQHPCVRHHHRFCRRRHILSCGRFAWSPLSLSNGARPRARSEEGRRSDFMPASGLTRSLARRPAISRGRLALGEPSPHVRYRLRRRV